MIPQQSREEQAAQEALRSHLERKGGFYTILLSGLDDDNGDSDTNILVAVDTVNGYVYGVSIPRDSKAVSDGKSHKINAAYSKGGTEQAGKGRVGPVGHSGGLHRQRQSKRLSPRWWMPSAAWISRYPSIWTMTTPSRTSASTSKRECSISTARTPCGWSASATITTAAATAARIWAAWPPSRSS